MAAISGKNTQETQKELCCALDIEIKEPERQRVQKDASVRLELTFSKKQYEKLSQCRDLLVHLLQKGQKDYSWASVVETLMDQYLNKKSLTEDADKKEIAKGDQWTGTDLNTNADASSITNSNADIKIAANNGADINVIADAAAGCGNNYYRGNHNSYNDLGGSIDRDRRGEAPRAGVNKSLTPKVKAKIFRRDRCCQFEDPVFRKKCGSTFGLRLIIELHVGQIK